MTNAPNSYKDPYWTNLALATEAKLGLPNGILTSVVMQGERSNNNQVSEAGAKTVFQITPPTRKAAIEKYGIDPYLSPDNAAEVAGRLLKESLDRNKGAVATAVAEYHGGTDRRRWGPRTRAYVARVVNAQRKDIAAPAPSSTFQSVMSDNPAYAQQQKAPSSQIAQVYQLYKDGQLSAQEAADFEEDVKSGLVMLPRDAELNGSSASGPILLPQAITDAYRLGQLTPQERSDLEQDIQAGLVKLPPATVDMIPQDDNWVPPTEQGVIPPREEPNLGQQLLGGAEAGLTALTGATSGAIGMVGGAVKQLSQNVLDGSFGTPQAAHLVQQAAQRGGESLTYMPRTETGQEYAQNVGEFMQQAIPAMPMTAELQMLGQGIKQAAPAVGSRAALTANQVLDTIKPPIAKVVDAVKGRVANLRSSQPEIADGRVPLAMAGVGAAETDVGAMRRAAAEEMFPPHARLTKGQATDDFGQRQFEEGVAKNAELGEPMRQRIAEQHAAIQQRFDTWIDETGSEAPDNHARGTNIHAALHADLKRSNSEINAAYGAADTAGELRDAVKLPGLIELLNKERPAEELAPILKLARQQVLNKKAAVEDVDGSLVATDLTLKEAENIRKFVVKYTNYDPNNLRVSKNIKKAIDTDTLNAGGDLYARARFLRTKHAERFENRAVIADILANKSSTRGDRKVALEDVAKRIVFQSSLDSMRFARVALLTSGKLGKQAWKDVESYVLEHIISEATKGVARESSGAKAINPAALHKTISLLDKSGKLAWVFGKNGAKKLRAMDELAQIMLVRPEGTFNTSHTATIILAALDAIVTFSTGLPLPVLSGIKLLTKEIKDRKVRARIEDALK